MSNCDIWPNHDVARHREWGDCVGSSQNFILVSRFPIFRVSETLWNFFIWYTYCTRIYQTIPILEKLASPPVVICRWNSQFKSPRPSGLIDHRCLTQRTLELDCHGIWGPWSQRLKAPRVADCRPQPIWVVVSPQKVAHWPVETQCHYLVLLPRE